MSTRRKKSMRNLIYHFEFVFLGALLLFAPQFAAGQSAAQQKDDTKKLQITIPADPRTLGDKKYQELKAKGLLPQPAQIPFSKETAKRNMFTIQGVEPLPRTPQLEIPLDGTFTQSMPRNDDGSTGLITLPFTFTFYGTPYTGLYINNNGDVTFTDPYGSYSPTGFPSSAIPPMIAPFWADVETNPTASGVVWHKVQAHRIIIIWDHVGYYSYHTDKLNTFELVLTDGTDPTVGIGKNCCFSYDDMEWTTGDASGGSGGFGGAAATVGINKGDGVDFALIGRFDHAGTDYDGPGGSNDGVGYLSHKNFCFNVGTLIGSIAGTKFNDFNGDGVFDPSDPGIEGWTIYLTGSATATTTTDASGDYKFSNLPPGTYTVSEEQRVGWTQTFPGGGTYTVTIAFGEDFTGMDFGNHQSIGRGNILGLVFDDRNGNGAKDPDEPGLSAWRVQLSGPGGISTLTDANGNYAFSNIPAGNYAVTIFLPSGWAQTLPPGGEPRNVTVVTGGTVSGVDFGTRIVTGIEESRGNPTEYELYQNFPNPFNPTTRLSFYLPKDGYVTLNVYNVLGIEVASLFEGRMSVGMHSLTWDAQDIPSGVYIYRLTAGSFTAVKKMILMK
jgi:hypothetical protein